MQRRKLIFPFAVAATLAVPALSYWLFLPEPAPLAPPPVAAAAPPPAPAVEEPAPSTLRISEATGLVEVRRAKGEFAPAAVGDVLSQSDAIRTGDGGSAALSAEGRYTVRLEPASSFEVTELTATADRFLLGGGMARAEVMPGRTFSVAAGGTDAVAEVEGGGAAFAISSNGAGTVAVGTERGEVGFRAAGGAVVVKAGEESIARPGQKPSAPAPAPSSLLLKVAWPTGGATNQPRLAVKGKTTPGTVVSVAGKAVRVEADGKFATVVVLKEGENRVPVEASSVSGVRASDRGPAIKLDTRGAPAAFETKDLWGDR